MDRNREARRASILGSNGFNRRRHRTNSLRDSPADEDGGLELQETVRLRDRVKKDRDRERDRDRDRDRERERERGREGQRERDLRERSSRSKRRRAERLTSNREDTGGDETSEEESLNDDEDDEDEENATTGGGVRLLTQAVGSVPNHHHHGHISNHHHHGHISNHHHGHNSSFSQQQHNSNSTSNIVSSNNNHLQHRKSFPQNHSSAKISRAPPVWKSGDEMISVPVPRKARSASTKRSHDWISMSSNNSGGVSGVEQNPGQASTSPARQGVVPTLTPTPPAPVSPTSPNASIRKKPKPSVNNSGPKVKPSKVAAKPSSSNPEELEIEIAEVLYGLMTQSQAPLLKKDDSREINRLSGDAKSRNSSPISNPASANNLILGSHSGPLSAVPPKRKRPRQIPENSSCGARSSSIQAKPDVDRKPSETSSPCTEKTSGSTAEKGYEMTENSIGPQAALTQPSVPTPLEPAKMDLELKPAPEELRRSRDPVAKEEGSMKEKGSTAAEVSHNGDLSAAETTKPISIAAAMENRMEEKFEIDLMAPPPHIRPSPDREVKTDLIDSPVDQKPVVSKTEANLKSKTTKDQTDKNGKSGDIFPTAAAEENNAKWSGEEAESNKAIENERDVDLRLDLENSERDGGSGVNASKSQSLTQKQQQQMPPNEKSVHLTSSLPLPMSVGSWPGGLPPMGYMAPLQGVVSMEGGAVAPGHIPQPLFGQPRPKRCATHCHIARNIHYIQQCSKMNPFWPAPAASASLFGSKPCNLIGLPGPDLHGNVAVRGANSGQDKGQNLTSIPNHVAKEKGSHPANTLDSAQRKQQILVQQALPPVAPSNLLGPAFIFPMNQQQSAAPRPSGAKSPVAGVSSNTSAVASSSPAAAVSFNFPNMGSSETPYLAILQNNGYTFPIPAGAVGAPQNYRGTQAQAMPMFNGSFYSSQMIHPSQLQQAHQNASASGVSSMPQKQQQRMQSGGAGNVSSSLKTQPSQQVHNQYGQQTRPRHHEGEPGREDSPSTTDSRGSRVSMNIYGQNFAMPIHPQNFGLMTHPAALASSGTGAAMSVSSNHGDKKQGSKTGPESLPAHSFAMTFGTMNGAAGPGMEWVQTHAAFQSSSEATRQNMQQMMAAAAAAQAAHNFRDSDDGKSGGADSSATEDERKSLTGKTLGGGGGQSIAFTRSDLADEPLNAAAGANRGSRSMSTNSVGATNIQNAHSIQTQLQQQHMLLKQQQQQMAATAVNRGSTNGVGAMNVQTANSIHQTQLQQQHMLLKQQQQLQQQQQMAANAANRSKAATATSNGGVYSEHLSSSSTMAAKFPTGFPQNLVQSNSSSPSQSPQWKASGRTSTSQPPSSLASSATPTLKNLPQQHSRTQAPMHTQISFGGNQKPSPASQGQSHPTNNQTTSSQMMVGSPTTSSVSKGASGSPRTASSASTTNKVGQASSLSAQPSNNSPSVPNQKSTSMLGNPQVAGAAASGNVQKSQLQHQSHQQMPKAMQQQFFFSNPYAQSQSPQASKSSAPSGSSGYYMTRRQNDQHQQSPGAPVTSAVGLSLCPPTNTNDPATAIAAATANVKGGALPSQGIAHAQQFAVHTAGTMLPAGFSYAHPVPTAVQVKPVELKQPAGNDNLRTWQSEKK